MIEFYMCNTCDRISFYDEGDELQCSCDSTDLCPIDPVDKEDAFDSMLDECYPMVEVFGMNYMPSAVLKKLSPIRYNDMLNDYENSMLDSDEWLFAHDQLFANPNFRN